MKTYIILSIVLVSFLYWKQVSADVLRLDKSVSVPSANLSADAVTAFQSSTNCRLWNYIPSHLVSSKSFRHSTDITSTKIAGHKAIAYVSALELMASPDFSQADLNQLQNKIFATVSADPDCAKQVPNKDAIVLSPALVQSLPNATATPENESDPNFSKIFPTYGTAQADAYRDPMNPMSVTYMVDASDSYSASRLRDLGVASQNQPTEMGKLLYSLPGVTARVDSHLRYQGTMTAEFASDIQKTHCTVSSSSKSLTVAGAAAGIAGAGVGGLGVGYNENSTTCDFNLITQFRGGSYKSVFLMDHSRSKLDVDGKPIMYVTCNEKGACDTLPLSDFIEYRLYTDLLLTNFDIIIRELGGGTFDVTLGRRGAVSTTINVDIGYLRNFNGKMALEVPVFADRLDEKSFDFSWINDPFYNCAKQYFRSQSALYSDYVRTSPMPVADACFQTPTN